MLCRKVVSGSVVGSDLPGYQLVMPGDGLDSSNVFNKNSHVASCRNVILLACLVWAEVTHPFTQSNRGGHLARILRTASLTAQRPRVSH